MILVVIFCLPALASASWSDSFSQDSFSDPLVNEKKYIVASVENEEAPGEADAVAEAMIGALRNSGAELVMGDAALGSISELKDDAIIEKATQRNVDYVSVIRVYPGGQSGKATAVINTYNPKGKLTWTVSVNRGHKVKAQQLEETKGVSAQTSEAVSEVTEENSKSVEKKRQKFAEKFLWFNGFNRPLRGKYAEKITFSKFYRDVGRPDLAKEYEANKSKATTGGIVGGIGYLGLVGGGTWWLISSTPGMGSSTVPAVITLSGLGGVIAGALITPDRIQPVERSEAFKLADQHNQKLRDKTGVGSDYNPIPDKDEQSIDYSFQFGVTQNGGFGGLRVRF
jgi:hypothetical protein